MDALHQLEIAWLLWIQSLGVWLAGPLKLITTLGTEDFFIIVMPALYWCLDGVLGFRMGTMLLLTNGLGSVLKLAFHAPRPYWVDTRIQALSAESSFGIPSGHAQHAASVWGLIAVWSRSTGARIFFVVLIFLIGFSRLYLGMHFVSDVLAGWLVGILLLWLFLTVEKRVRPWLKGLALRQMLVLALVTSLVLVAAPVLTRMSLGDWQVPAAWEETALVTLPEGEIHPLELSGAFTVAGTWLGLMAGAAWYFHRTGGLFNTAGAPHHRLLRYVVGLVGIMVLWYGLGMIFPRGEDVVSYALRYLRYTLVGLWVSAAAPLVFQRIGLAGRQEAPIPSLSTD